MRISSHTSSFARAFTRMKRARKQDETKPSSSQHEWLRSRAFHTLTSRYIYFHFSSRFRNPLLSVACLVWWQMVASLCEFSLLVILCKEYLQISCHTAYSVLASKHTHCVCVCLYVRTSNGVMHSSLHILSGT